MAKTAVSQWSTTAGSNTDVGGISLAEGMFPDGINNAMREMMAQIAAFSTGGPSTFSTVTVNTSIIPDANDGAVIGSASLRWSDLFLATGGVINWGTATITETAGALRFGGNVEMTNSTSIAWGTAAQSTLFASGTNGLNLDIYAAGTLVVNSIGLMTLGGSDVQLATTAGNNTASVVTVGGSQTLTNKALNGTIGATTPTTGVFTTATINTSIIPDADDGATIGSGSRGWSDLYLADGGKIDWWNGNTTLVHSQTLPSGGPGLTVNGELRVAYSPLVSHAESVVLCGGGTQTITGKAFNGTLGATTPATGVFTTATINTSIAPDAANGATCGTQALGWAEVNLGTGGEIGWNNRDVTITHSSNLLTFAGGNYSFTGTVNVSSSLFVQSGGLTVDGGIDAGTGPISCGTFAQGTSGVIITSNQIRQSVHVSTFFVHQEYWNTNASRVGSISSTGTATAFGTSSDVRLKENFRDFDSGTIIDAINTYQFDWKSDGKAAYGVKAQECFEVYPDAICVGSTGDQEGDATFEPWEADYSKFVPVLLAELKALRLRVAAMEAKNGA